MKKLITIFFALTILSCNAWKNKEKTKEKQTSESTLQVRAASSYSQDQSGRHQSSDSTAGVVSAIGSVSMQRILQTLKLKSSGKCTDTTTSFLRYRDASGAELSVPVSSGTEFEFGNETNSENDKFNLKMENISIKKENDSLRVLIKSASQTNIKSEIKDKNLTNLVNTETKSPTFWSYLFWCLLSIVAFKIIEIYVKKLIFK